MTTRIVAALIQSLAKSFFPTTKTRVSDCELSLFVHCSLMKILGLFFVRPKGQKLFRRRFLRHVTPLQLYCVCVLATSAVLALRSLLVFGHGSNKFGYRLFLKVRLSSMNCSNLQSVLRFFPQETRRLFCFQIFWAMYWYDCCSRQWYILKISWPKKDNIQAVFLNMEARCFSGSIIPYERFETHCFSNRLKLVSVGRILEEVGPNPPNRTFSKRMKLRTFLSKQFGRMHAQTPWTCRALKTQMRYGLVYVLLQLILTGGLAAWGLYDARLQARICD